MGERPAPQPVENGPRGFGPHAYEGVPVAERPRRKQIGCETCGQSLEPHQRRVKCHMCCLWIHDECIETLHIGTKWHADMCLACQQRSTRKLRVISAIELRRGNRWDQDIWFKDFVNFVRMDTGYGESRNRDLNELESLLAKAILNGLHYYRDAQAPASTTDGETARTEELGDPPGEPTPLAKAEAPRTEEPPQEPASLGVQEGKGKTQYHRLDTGPQPPETTEGKGLRERTGVRVERDVRPDEGHADSHPRPRAESYHSARSASREERMLALEETVLRMEDAVQRISQALESGGFRSAELRGPPPKARPDYGEYPYDRHPSYRRPSSPYQGQQVSIILR